MSGERIPCRVPFCRRTAARRRFPDSRGNHLRQALSAGVRNAAQAHDEGPAEVETRAPP
jgi:hypothetical protein